MFTYYWTWTNWNIPTKIRKISLLVLLVLSLVLLYGDLDVIDIANDFGQFGDWRQSRLCHCIPSNDKVNSIAEKIDVTNTIVFVGWKSFFQVLELQILEMRFDMVPGRERKVRK